MAEPHSYIHPRDEILDTIERIYRYRMTTTSGGNLSIREENGDVWITPARIDKGGLRRDDIVCVHPDGRVEGPHAPSSELPFHQEIYRARPDARGVVHAHPVALVAFSVAGQAPDSRLFHQARHVCGEVGFAPYRLPGSGALAEAVAGTFAQGFDCVVLENHGVVTAGGSLRQAFHRFETLEFTAKTLIKARLLGEVRYLDEIQLRLPRASAQRIPECEREAPSSGEKECRRALCEFVRRSYRQRLFISTQGSFSVRLDEESFLITPYEVDRGALHPADPVYVRRGCAEAGKTPSRAAALHDAVYRRHRGVAGIINAYPVNATAFSVTGVALDTRTIPESYLVLREVGRIPFGLQFEAPDEVARMVSLEQPAALLENDGVLVVGAGILETFDRLEVLESTAEALINCGVIGSLAPISDDAIRELKAAFPGA